MSIRNERKRFSLVLALFLIDLFVYLGSRSNHMVVTTDAYHLYFYAIVTINVLAVIAFFLYRKLLGFYLASYLSVYLIGLLSITRNSTTIIFIVPSLLLILYFLYMIPVKGKVSRFLSIGLVLLFMFYIGKTFLFINQPVPGMITIENLSDKITGIGLSAPMTESYGLFISTSFADVILSPVQFLLLLAISSPLVENYHKIFGLLLGKKVNKNGTHSGDSGLISAGYGIVSTFSCQCESAIALLPSVTILILSILEIPFFLISISLLLMTYFLISNYYSRGKLPHFLTNMKMAFRKRVFIIAPIIVISQLLTVVGILFSLEKSPFFLFGINMVMLLDGFLLFYIFEPSLSNFKIRERASIALISLSIVIVFIWFYPPFTSLAIRMPGYFEAMSYSMTLVGIVTGFVYFLSKGSYGVNLLEVFVVAIGLIPLIIYYFTFFLGDSIWGFWSLSEQMELALVLWLIMLPIMWITTQRSLAEPIIKSRLTFQNVPIF